MRDEIIDLQIEINEKVHDIHELTQNIKRLDEIIVSGEHEFDEDVIHTQMHDTIEQYKKIVNQTRILLEAYFHEESKLGEPADFVYRRLYKKLLQAY